MKYKRLAMIMGVMITATSVGSTATAFAADSKTENTQDSLYDMGGNLLI